MKFDVIATRTYQRSIQREIEADSEEEARAEAERILNDTTGSLDLVDDDYFEISLVPNSIKIADL